MFVNNVSNARMSKFGSGVVLRSRNQEPLDMDYVRRVAPSVFAEEKHSSRSERFTYLPTVEALDALKGEGFEPYEVRQGGSRDEEKRGFTKHLIRLRKQGDVMRHKGDAIREVLLLNAHDGTSSYRLMSGVFVMVCSNGMIVSDGKMQDIRIPHKGDVKGEIIEAAYTIVEDGKRIDKSMADMKAIELQRPQQEAFAKAALTLKYGDETPPVEPRALLAPRRFEDNSPTLWHTFNRVQENLIERGGLSYTQRNERTRRITRRQTRPVNGIGENVRLNQALWVLADELRKAA